jgi:hypothetical protein
MNKGRENSDWVVLQMFKIANLRSWSELLIEIQIHVAYDGGDE